MPQFKTRGDVAFGAERVGLPSATPAPRIPRKFFLALALALLAPSAHAVSVDRRATAGRDAAAVTQSVVTDDERAAAAFDAARAFAHVKKLVDIGPRPPGSKQIEKARKYIGEELKSYGLSSGGNRIWHEEFEAQTPAGRRKMVNVVAELAGETPDFIIIASHYDTKVFKDVRFVGANDGGSSVGVLLELARVLAAAPRKSHFGYRFVFFDGEEAFCREWDDCGTPDAPDNTYGSRHHVKSLQEGGDIKRLRAMILLDMVGYRRLQLGRDTTSTPWLVDLIWKTAGELGHGAQFVERAEEVGGDDHDPFLKAGVDAVDIIQLNSYPHWHTVEDTLDKIAPQALKIVGDVVLASLPRVEEELKKRSKAER